MKRIPVITLITLMTFVFLFSRCDQSKTETSTSQPDSTQATSTSYGGFGSEVAWGQHLVTIGGCNDCHTPKKMGPNGPEFDMSLELSGNPSRQPAPQVDRKEFESRGYIASTIGFNSYVGPWGISYAANITSDSTTGIGTWTLDQFIRTFRIGKIGGAPQGRDLLPPMPWQGIGKMTDAELKAMYTYLESTKPIHNVVPSPVPPVMPIKK